MEDSENRVIGPIRVARDYLYCPHKKEWDRQRQTYLPDDPWPYVKDRLMQYEFGRLGTTQLLCLGRSVLQDSLQQLLRACENPQDMEVFLSSLTETRRERVIFLLLSLQDGGSLQKTFQAVSKKKTPELVPPPNSAA
jgi:hypothetical protein